MTLQWNADQTLIVREVPGGVQFIPATTENVTYQEEILPLLEAGLVIAPFVPPLSDPDPDPDWAEFRGTIALMPWYERILDAIAAISITRQSSVVQAWSKVEDKVSLVRAVGFWNLQVVPYAAITEAESKAIAAHAKKYRIPIEVATDGFLSVVEDENVPV